VAAIKYPVLIVQNKETGVFFIQTYDIPEGFTQGDTREEAKKSLLSVFQDVLEFNHFEQNKPVPLPSKTENISLEKMQEFCPWVTLVGEVKDYLDWVELSKDMSQKILTHNGTFPDS
jgi:predicted RNase H-like HicB family nuclease